MKSLPRLSLSCLSVLIAVLPLTPIVESSYAARARGQVVLDTVLGQTAPGELSYPQATFVFRVLTEPTSCEVSGLYNGFRVYSPDGATFEQDDIISIATLNNFMDFFEFAQSIGVHYGVSADTARFSGLSITPPHLPAGYTGQAFSITVFPRQEDVGKTICIDSSFYRAVGKFQWVCDIGTDTNAAPGWDGPHCFTIAHPAYTPESPAPAPVTCQVALATDIDRDNLTDIVYTSAAAPYGLYVAWGEPDFSFDTSTVSDALTHGGRIDLGYINADVLPDMVVSTGSGLYAFIQGEDPDGTGSRIFTEFSLPLPAGSNTALTTGFFNDDSFLDAITSGGGGGGQAFFRDGGTNVYYGTGTGSFTAGPSLTIGVKAVGAGDFNNDGLDDFAAVHGPLGIDSVQLALGDGVGGFTFSNSVAAYPDVTEDDRDLKVGDFDGDGKDDFAFLTHPLSGGTSLCYAFGDGTGEFSTPDCRLIDGIANNLAVGDFNGDNLQDIATVQGTVSQTLLVYYSDVSRTFADTQAIDLPLGTTAASALAAGDFNHDGNLDFLIGSSDPAGEPLLQLTSTLPQQPVLPFEMTVTSYSSSRPPDAPPGSNPPVDNISPVDIKIIDPAGRVVARVGSTVAGAVAWAGDVDGNTQVDQRLINYNVLEGTHKIIVTPREGIPPGSSFTMSIRLDGSAQAISHYNYLLNSGTGLSTQAATTPLVYLYEVHQLEEPSPILPVNGQPTNSLTPAFDWSAKVAGQPSGTLYKIQLSPFHDFHLLYSEMSGLATPAFRPSTALPKDTVLFWRYSAAPDGINYEPFDPEVYYSVYVTGCCQGITGNLDADSGDLTDPSDLQAIVDYIFFNVPLISDCAEENDVTGDAVTDGSDLQFLVDYIFFSLAEPPSCP